MTKPLAHKATKSPAQGVLFVPGQSSQTFISFKNRLESDFTVSVPLWPSSYVT
nr:MAG TPA: hypothetical protein [Bacteriophage sp.]